MTLGIVYRPPSQNKLFRTMNEHFYKIGNINKETYILGHRNTNMYLNDKYVFEKSSPTVSNTISYEVHKLLIVVKKFCILGKLS